MIDPDRPIMTVDEVGEYAQEVQALADKKWRVYSGLLRVYFALNRVANPSTDKDNPNYINISPSEIKYYNWSVCVAEAHAELSRNEKWKRFRLFEI